MITHSRAIALPGWAGKPVETALEGWPVVERFEPPEGDCAVGLTDLSHRPKAIVQGAGVEGLGLTRPGQAIWNGQFLAGCLKPGHAVVLDLTGPLEMKSADASWTDMTDGWVLLGLWGPKSPEVVQGLVTVDVEPRERGGALFFATSCHGVPVQLFNLRAPKPGFVISCARSHGQNLFEACIRAGRQSGLKIMGLKAHGDWLCSLAA